MKKGLSRLTVPDTTINNAKKQGKRRITISRSFLRWLLLIVVVGFLASMAFTWIHQTNMSNMSAAELLHINVWDVRQDVIDASDENLLKITRSIAAELDGGAPSNSESLMRLMRAYDVAEINIINERGIITATTMGKFRDYDMSSGEQSAEFLGLLDGTEDEHVQSYQPTSFDHSLYRKYAAVNLKSGGFIAPSRVERLPA